jgi:hypothetical protein
MHVEKKNFTRLIALSVLLAPLWCAVGQSSPGPEAVLKEDVFQFQAVLEGTPVVHEFVIHNRGDEDLKILNIQSG